MSWHVSSKMRGVCVCVYVCVWQGGERKRLSALKRHYDSGAEMSIKQFKKTYDDSYLCVLAVFLPP